MLNEPVPGSAEHPAQPHLRTGTRQVRGSHGGQDLLTQEGQHVLLSREVGEERTFADVRGLSDLSH